MSVTIRSILDHLDTIAVLTGGLFAGANFYLSFGETPALRKFGLNEHWRFFPHMFERVAIVQPFLIVIAGTAGIIHGTRIVGAPFYRNLWVAAGSTFLAIVPFTIVLLDRTNRTIINDNKIVKLGNESQINVATKEELLDKWATLHFVCTIASIAGFGAMVFGLSRHSSFVYT
jgi:uncharacterized membrane protein